MAKTAAIKVSVDIEYIVIGNALGLLIASGGLLAGVMVHERSFDYWPEDLVPLLLAGFMAFRLMRSFTAAVNASSAPVHRPQSARQTVTPEPVAMGQLPPVPGYTAEQVLEAVSKRIEANKGKAK
ncbi:hypothetical protein [Pelotalea chapellei]|uniref:Uncharacterized protein n=1 Tax=Pelotalea chapellei TaxID=44671 RepID=A0ABS5U5Q3_9BACT|nr:hypothetical protein [Pelotalea chapellei]MBT1070984.1 hypothetical protein [Pelotalea chapellei]